MPRRFQFSLRALFVLVTAVAVWLGVQLNSARRQATIVSAIQQLEYGFVYYDWEFDEDDQETGATHLPGPAWLRNLIGDDHFQTVIAVCIYDPHLKEELLPAIDKLPALRTLVLNGTQAGDATMLRISRLKHLRFLDITQTQVSDLGVVQLAKLPALKALWVGTWDVPPGRSVTAAGLKRIAPAIELEHLEVLGPGFTDASIPVFEQFKNLRELCLDHTRVTKEGEERLKRKLPNCKYRGTSADLRRLTSIERPSLCLPKSNGCPLSGHSATDNSRGPANFGFSKACLRCPKVVATERRQCADLSEATKLGSAAIMENTMHPRTPDLQRRELLT